jgi:hypothetical protein
MRCSVVSQWNQRATLSSSAQSDVYQHRCTRKKKRLLISGARTMTQQNQPNQPQQGNKPGQPNPMPNKPGQSSQQSSGGQHDQTTNKK